MVEVIETDRVVTHIMELVAAGNDTTANLMGHMVMFFDEAPDQRVYEPVMTVLTLESLHAEWPSR